MNLQHCGWVLPAFCGTGRRAGQTQTYLIYNVLDLQCTKYSFKKKLLTWFKFMLYPAKKFVKKSQIFALLSHLPPFGSRHHLFLAEDNLDVVLCLSFLFPFL